MSLISQQSFGSVEILVQSNDEGKLSICKGKSEITLTTDQVSALIELLKLHHKNMSGKLLEVLE